ncbi:MAG: MFS transporter [Candidatus Binatia bacterium]|nr:MFS transporter [Candidatus Binatia bacterium]
MSQIPSHERANLWVVCAAQFLCLAGMTAILPLLPLYLEQIGVEGQDNVRYWTGALSAAPFVIAIFATPMWGALADRIGHKPMVVRSVIGIAIVSAGMGFATAPIELLAWRGLQGAVSGVFPAAVGLLTTLTPEARMGRSLAILQATRSGGVLSGPLIGGVLADVVGIRPLFLGVGAIAIVTAGVCMLVLEERSEAPQPQNALGTPRWRDLMGQRSVLGMLAVVLIYQVAVMSSWPTMALFVEQLGIEKDAVATMTGVVIFAQGLPAMLLATSWVRLVPRFGLARVLGTAVILSGVLNFAVGLAPGIVSVLVLRALTGAAMAGFIPLSFQWLNGYAPENARGRMAGISSTSMMLGNVIGSFLGSWLSVEIGLGATFWVPGIVLTITGVTFAIASRSRR